MTSLEISGCSRLMANGDYWGLMGIYFQYNVTKNHREIIENLTW